LVIRSACGRQTISGNVLVDTDVPNQKKKMEVKFKHLALGCKFSFIGSTRTIFIKLNDNTVAQWNKDESIICFVKQVVMDFGDPEKLVLFRDPYTGENYHEYPKTAFQEGYDSYMRSPGWCDNPYEEGTQAHKDFDDGYYESDMDDCE
jgi:hypothetical protein